MHDLYNNNNNDDNTGRAATGGASSFLRNQEQRIEFRQNVKSQFEKEDLTDQDEFEKLVLLNIKKQNVVDQSLTLPKKEETAAPKLSKQSTLAFGGLGLKFREKIMKESENPSSGKFYDFLMTLRDRENLLSDKMRDVQKPKY